MGKKKADVTQESFITSTEAVTAELAADIASEALEMCGNKECPNTASGTMYPGNCSLSFEEREEKPFSECPDFMAEQVPVETIPAIPAELMHEGDPCTHCGAAHDDVEAGACPARLIAPLTSDGNRGPYVTRDPDFIGPTFSRSLPVPVPAEELAELAKKMSHTHGIWCKAKLDAKAAAKGFKGITDRAEDEMVELAAIIEEGTEERPVVCRWEFDYAAGVKKLRRLDNHQIADEETLKGEELHLSFNFNGSSEAAVEQLAATQAGIVSVCDGCTVENPDCLNCPDHQKPKEFSDLTPEEIDQINSEVDGEATEAQSGQSTETGTYVCKVCNANVESHIYLVRHLRDVHALKLSEYKVQFPA